MIVIFTYDDGENVSVVSYSTEYGEMRAGDAQTLERITLEVREPKTNPLVGPAGEVALVPVLDVPMRVDVPVVPVPSPRETVKTKPARCIVCDHPDHGKEVCTVYNPEAHGTCDCYGA